MLYEELGTHTKFRFATSHNILRLPCHVTTWQILSPGSDSEGLNNMFSNNSTCDNHLKRQISGYRVNDRKNPQFLFITSFVDIIIATTRQGTTFLPRNIGALTRKLSQVSSTWTRDDVTYTAYLARFVCLVGLVDEPWYHVTVKHVEVVVGSKHVAGNHWPAGLLSIQMHTVRFITCLLNIQQNLAKWSKLKL